MGDASNEKWLYGLCAVAFIGVMFSLLTQERAPARERIVSTDELTRYARAELEDLQARSITNNQEYCGVIFEDEDGGLHTSRIYEGDRATCAFDWGVPLGNHVVASFHTHGGYDEDFDSEMPSIEDLANDIDARIDGFISTPGGRLWHVHWQDETATQVCGEGCMEQDPRYAGTQTEQLQRSYSFEDLQARGRTIILDQ
ncbi:DUF4329 domain-containing protein [Qipengyuania vesicularis]|uniref:DUF4329 domain-containing protein n=1 Tax=Qipengyuania vesicularis TaxID=2867232 RepID=UPI001C86C0B3|nr:DUF4329 domain-containing protein [Qipengyuania vesicularis]MBX7527098.1 DUF4329 domain-containing protein [Qipengyuania vesicularis]